MTILDKHDISDFKGRVLTTGIFFAIIFVAIVGRLYYLQVIKGDFYRLFSDKNRLKEIRIRAPRGIIYDRNGVILADNKPSFDAYLTRGFVKDLRLTLNMLQPILGFSDTAKEELREKIRNYPKFKEFLLKDDITWDQLAKIEALSLDLPGVSIEVIPVRDYPYGDLFFHTLGYVSAIDKYELEHIEERVRERYHLNDVIGKKGLERSYESILKGTDGRNIVVVNAKGEPVDIGGVNIIPPELRQETIAGNNIWTSIDLSVQQTAREAFKDNHGAAVMVDVHTGQIRAMISRPSFDPHPFNRGIPREVLNQLMQNPYKPFLDKTIQEHYPPGSTFKMIMASAALSEGFDPERKYNCPGSFRMGRGLWRCWQKNGHGQIGLHRAIVQSCDVFFYNLGLFLGLANIGTYAKSFGLGQILGVDIGPEIPGMIPSLQWFEKVAKITTLEAETINASIGQGAVVATPLQMAFATSVLANGGILYKPQLVAKIESLNFKSDTRRIPSVVISNIGLQPEIRNYVLTAMTGVTSETGGTAYWTARLPNISIAGKTGTAQVRKLPPDRMTDKDVDWWLRDHAWFIATAPAENPVVAVSVIVEHAGHGSTYAAPIAKAMIKAYFDSETKRTEASAAPTVTMPTTQAGLPAQKGATHP